MYGSYSEGKTCLHKFTHSVFSCFSWNTLILIEDHVASYSGRKSTKNEFDYLYTFQADGATDDGEVDIY